MATQTYYLDKRILVSGESNLQKFDNPLNLKTYIQECAGTKGTFLAGYYPLGTTQALSGAGAINVTSYCTNWTTTAADAGTLADGTEVGQRKKIKLVVDGGDGTLTPTNLAGGTTITFNDANDYVELIWDGANWNVIENFGTTVA